MICRYAASCAWIFSLALWSIAAIGWSLRDLQTCQRSSIDARGRQSMIPSDRLSEPGLDQIEAFETILNRSCLLSSRLE